CSGECSAKRGRVLPGQVGGLDREAQPHEVPIGHDHMAGTLRRMADRDDREAPPVERVHRIRHLDLVRVELKWVLEGGIKLLSRSSHGSAYPAAGVVPGRTLHRTTDNDGPSSEIRSPCAGCHPW